MRPILSLIAPESEHSGSVYEDHHDHRRGGLQRPSLDQ